MALTSIKISCTAVALLVLGISAGSCHGQVQPLELPPPQVKPIAAKLLPAAPLPPVAAKKLTAAHLKPTTPIELAPPNVTPVAAKELPPPAVIVVKPGEATSVPEEPEGKEHAAALPAPPPPSAPASIVIEDPLNPVLVWKPVAHDPSLSPNDFNPAVY